MMLRSSRAKWSSALGVNMFTSLRFAVFLIAVAGSVLPAMGANAEDVEAILKKGTDLRRQGRDAEALAEFQRAQRIQNSPRAMAQIALAEQALGLWQDASNHLGHALEQASDPWIAKNRPVLDSALSTIHEHLGAVEVAGTPAGAEILLDGIRVGNLPSVSTWVTPGDVSLQVKANGYTDALRTLKVSQGGHVREHVDLRRAPSAAVVANLGAAAPVDQPPTLIANAPSAAAPEGTSDIPKHSRWGIWALVGAGAVVVAAAGATVWALGRHEGCVASATQSCW